MKYFSFILCFFMLIFGALAQPTVEKQRLLGGSGNEEAFNVISTTDGGLLLVGYSTSSKDGDVKGINFGDKDYWIVKLDAEFNVQWEKNYGTVNEDVAFKAIEGDKGHFLVIGKTGKTLNNLGYLDTQSNYDYWLLELDENGDTIRGKTFGSPYIDDAPGVPGLTDGFTQVEMIRSLDDGYLIIAGDITVLRPPGEFDLDIWFLKLDWDTWEVKSEKKHDFQGTDTRQISLCGGLWELQKGDFILGGLIINAPNDVNDEFWVRKIDSKGEFKNGDEKLFGGENDEGLYDLIVDEDGNIVLVGQSNSPSGSGDVPFNHTLNNVPSTDIWVLKLNQNLEIIWNKVFGGVGLDWGRSIIQADDGGYFIGGTTQGDNSGDVCVQERIRVSAYLLKTKKDGTLDWTIQLGGMDTRNKIYAMTKQKSKLVIAGYTDGNNSYPNGTEHKGNLDMWVALINPSTCEELPKPIVKKTIQSDKTRLEVTNLPTNLEGILIRWTGKKKDTLTNDPWIDIPITDSSSYVAQFNFNCCFSERSDAISLAVPTIIEGGNWTITPNGDGKNDTFNPLWLDNSSSELEVFNLFGQCVFKADPYNKDWGGTYEGHLLPEGTYLFRAHVNENNRIYRGTINIRK